MEPPSRPPDTTEGRLVWGLLVLMTMATFGGPLGIWVVLRGGDRPGWPPDRPVEWATLLGTSGLVLGLMILAVALSIGHQRAAARRRAAAATGNAEPPGDSIS